MKIIHLLVLIFSSGKCLTQNPGSNVKTAKIRNRHFNNQLESLPFVPEEYRDGTNVMFDINHFRDTINLEDPQNTNLKNAIKEIIANNTISRGTEAQVFYV